MRFEVLKKRAVIESAKYKFNRESWAEDLYSTLRNILGHRAEITIEWMLENKHLFEIIYEASKNKSFKHVLSFDFNVMDSPLEGYLKQKGKGAKSE